VFCLVFQYETLFFLYVILYLEGNLIVLSVVDEKIGFLMKYSN
jgi:hypothetical protein